MPLCRFSEVLLQPNTAKVPAHFLSHNRVQRSKAARVHKAGRAVTADATTHMLVSKNAQRVFDGAPRSIDRKVGSILPRFHTEAILPVLPEASQSLGKTKPLLWIWIWWHRSGQQLLHGHFQLKLVLWETAYSSKPTMHVPFSNSNSVVYSALLYTVTKFTSSLPKEKVC